MKHFSPRTVQVLLAVCIGFLLVAPFVLYPQFLIEILCFSLLAAALNLLVSYAGLLSFGHAMFFGAAGYVTAHAIKGWGFEPALGIVVGVSVAAAMGAVTGSLAIRRQGIYFSMITLAFSQLVYFLALRMPFTGGEDGLQDVPRRAMFGLINMGNNLVMYFVVLAITAFGFFAIHRIVYSPFGQVLRAIRDNEQRAISLGYRVNNYKLMVYILSATLAGLAGSVKAVAFQVVTLTDLNWVTSGEALLILILGGLQTLVGPVVGAILIVAMSHYLATYAEWVLMIQGMVFVLVVLLFRKGIAGEFYAWLERRALRDQVAGHKPVTKEKT
jgi:branched-chain amino acid transport system permease protein